MCGARWNPRNSPVAVMPKQARSAEEAENLFAASTMFITDLATLLSE